MEDLNFTPVDSLIATDTKDESAGESLQSLEFRVTELELILLLRSMVRENFRNFSEFEVL
jgi:uncharacterized protein YehS (DUF1456 family)